MDSANTLCLQPGKISCTLFDEGIKHHILNGGVNLIEELVTGATEWSNNLDDDYLQRIKRGEIKMSDSLDEIADWIGAKSAALGKALKNYYDACAKEHDGQFTRHRKHLIPLNVPPFYAMKRRIVINTTHGGIKINESSQVLDKKKFKVVV